MKLIANKPCSFQGQKFYIGDEIPESYVVSPNAQEKLGVLTIAKDTQDPVEVEEKAAPAITVVIYADEDDMSLELTPEGLQSVFDVMTATVEEAEPIIGQMTDDDALILLHIADCRKGIKEAAEARAKAINQPEKKTEESAGEQ